MLFEKHVDSVICDFENNCAIYELLNNDFNDNDYDETYSRCMEHKECFLKHCNDYDNDIEELISSHVYGCYEVESASIECHVCNNIIIDTDILNEINNYN